MGVGGYRRVKNSSQTYPHTDRQINHITEGQGITGRSFGVFAPNSLHVVYLFVLLCL